MKITETNLRKMIKEELAAVMDEGILDPARDVMDWAGENARRQTRAGEEEDLKQFRQGARGDFHQAMASGGPMQEPQYSPPSRAKVNRAETEFHDQLRDKAAGPTGRAMRTPSTPGHIDMAPYEADAAGPSFGIGGVQTYDDLDAAVAANRSKPVREEQEGQDDRASRVAGAIADLLDALK